ncbi:MAG: tetratricopeptide repeat protein [Microcoleus sp. SM1_3_4]|nr:tetratricopeptide repeat protein [Microcoleus sp. SM1_3_4]
MKQVTDIKLLTMAHYHACQAKEWDDAAAIVLEVYDFLRYGNYFQLLKDLCEGLLPVGWQDKQQLVESTNTHIDILYRLGVTYHDLGKFVTSNQYLQVCYELAQQTNYLTRKADSLSYIALNYQHLENYQIAKKYLEKCLAIAREIQEFRIQCRVLQFLGKNHDYLGNYQEAIALYLEALELARQHYFIEEEAITIGNLSLTYAKIKNYDLTVDCICQCLAILEKSERGFSQINALRDLSNFHSNIKDSSILVDLVQEQVEMSVDLASGNGKVHDVNVLMVAYDALEEWKFFMTIFEKCLSGASETTSLPTRVNYLYEAGITYYKLFDINRLLEGLASQNRKIMLLVDLVKVMLKYKMIFAKSIEYNLREAEQICVKLQMPFLAKITKTPSRFAGN